jgi:hypothetical protein
VIGGRERETSSAGFFLLLLLLLIVLYVNFNLLAFTQVFLWIWTQSIFSILCRKDENLLLLKIYSIRKKKQNENLLNELLTKIFFLMRKS